MTTRVAKHYKPRKVSSAESIDGPCPIVRHGKLVSKRYLPPNANGHILIHCDCDCGKARRVSPDVWASGEAKHCGCGRKHRETTGVIADRRTGLRLVKKINREWLDDVSEVDRLAQSTRWVA